MMIVPIKKHVANSNCISGTGKRESMGTVSPASCPTEQKRQQPISSTK